MAQACNCCSARFGDRGAQPMFGAMAKNHCLLLAALVMTASCYTPPPRRWMRYEQAGPTEWSALGAGKFGGQVFGADVSIDLYNPDTRVLVTVENKSDATVTFAIGPEGAAPKAAIGEVLLREIDGAASGGPPMQSYAAKQDLAVEAGWRATFFLDRPLGRDPKLGQYFVLGSVVQGGEDERVRRYLPIVAELRGTVPVKPK